MKALFKKQLNEGKLIKNYEPGITQSITANADKIIYTQAMAMVSPIKMCGRSRFGLAITIKRAFQIEKQPIKVMTGSLFSS